MQRAAVACGDGDFTDPTLRIGVVDLGVQHHLHFPPERCHRRVIQPRIKFRQPRAPLPGDQRQHRAHRKLGLVHRLRVDHRAQHIDRALVHMRHHAFHIRLRQLVFPQRLLQGVRRRVRVTARGMEFE
ncbi:hypothetical protein D3C72_1850910 [compost metagenome]